MQKLYNNGTLGFGASRVSYTLCSGTKTQLSDSVTAHHAATFPLTGIVLRLQSALSSLHEQTECASFASEPTSVQRPVCHTSWAQRIIRRTGCLLIEASHQPLAYRECIADLSQLKSTGDPASRAGRSNPCRSISRGITGDAKTQKNHSSAIYSANRQSRKPKSGSPRSGRVDQRQRNTRQSSRAREAHELPVDTLCELALDTRVLARSARRASRERRKLRVQRLSVLAVLQSERCPPVECVRHGQVKSSWA